MRKHFFILFFLSVTLFSHGQISQVPKKNIIAHRGFWKTSGSVENSISSLKNAIELGVYGSEFDIRQTKDSVLVVFHDNIFEKMLIEESTYSQLLTKKLSNGENLPTLKDYLIEGKLSPPDFKLILDLKYHISIFNVLNLIDSLELNDKVEFVSFYYDYCKQLIGMNKGYKVSYLLGDINPERLHKEGFYGFDYQNVIIDKNPDWIKRANELGLKVMVWTVDSVKNIAKYYDMGVEYITTNSPFYTKSPRFANILSDLIVLYTDDKDAKTYYTINGSDPNPNINSVLYYKPIQYTRGTTIKAIATKDNCFNSEISTVIPGLYTSTDSVYNGDIISLKYFDFNGLESSSLKKGYNIIKISYKNKTSILKIYNK